jgi:hypothetical protein
MKDSFAPLCLCVYLVFSHKINFIVSEINFQTSEYLIAEIILYFCKMCFSEMDLKIEHYERKCY